MATNTVTTGNGRECDILLFILSLSQAGVLWHVLQYIFNYDYTLDESGVETNESTNQQVTTGYMYMSHLCL